MYITSLPVYSVYIISISVSIFKISDNRRKNDIKVQLVEFEDSEDFNYNFYLYLLLNSS